MLQMREELPRRRRWTIVPWAVAVTLIPLLLASCDQSARTNPDLQSQTSASSTDTESESKTNLGALHRRQAAKKAISVLDCEQIGYIFDDMYFYDKMFGANCHKTNGKVVVIRVYKNDSSVQPALDGWEPLIDADRQLLVGERWFAIGSGGELRLLADNFMSTSNISSTVPAVDAPRTVQSHAAETKCVSFASAALVNRVMAPDEFTKQAEMFDKAYSGLVKLVNRSLSKDDILKLRKLNSRAGGYAFEAYLSRFGDTVKQFCSKR